MLEPRSVISAATKRLPANASAEVRRAGRTTTQEAGQSAGKRSHLVPRLLQVSLVVRKVRPKSTGPRADNTRITFAKIVSTRAKTHHAAKATGTWLCGRGGKAGHIRKAPVEIVGQIEPAGRGKQRKAPAGRIAKRWTGIRRRAVGRHGRRCNIE